MNWPSSEVDERMLTPLLVHHKAVLITSPLYTDFNNPGAPGPSRRPVPGPSAAGRRTSRHPGADAGLEEGVRDLAPGRLRPGGRPPPGPPISVHVIPQVEVSERLDAYLGDQHPTRSGPSSVTYSTSPAPSPTEPTGLS